MRRRDLLGSAMGAMAAAVPGMPSPLSFRPALAADRQKASGTFSFDNRTPAWAEARGPRIVLHRSVSSYVPRGSRGPFESLARTDGVRFD